MLNFFRRQQSRLKWIWIAVIFIFSVTLVTLYIPVGDLGTVTLTNDVADVGGEVVTAEEFQTAYRNYLNQMRSQMTPEMMQAFRFETQIVNALIDQYVMVAEAKRLGLDVSAAEIERTVLQNPIFQESGAFIGLARYESVLLQNNLTVAQFESSIRNQILTGKLHSFLTAAATVSDEDVETEYRNRNEKVKLDYFVIDGPKFEDDVQLTADEQREYFEKNLARYNIPEKRQARYVFIDTIKIRTEMEVSEDELLAYFREHEQEYRIEARVRAQHILWKTQDKTPAEVEEIRQRATDVVRRAKDGEDFSELAREHSEDTSASVGGDLGSFGPGQMVPEFERVAFNLGEGGTSDLVETEFGIHIIRVNEKEEARIRPFEEVRAGIESIVKFRTAADLAAVTAQSVAVDLVGNPDFEAVAETHGGTVRETGPVGSGGSFPGLEETAELESRIFSLALNEIGTAVPVKDGFAIPIVTEIQEAHAAAFEEAADQVEEDLRAEKARELADEKATEVEQLLEAGRSLEAAGRAVSLEIQTSEMLTRDGSIGEFGSTSELDDQLFSLELETPGKPVTAAGKTIAFVVTEKEEVDLEQLQAGFDDLHAELLGTKRNQLFDAYSREVRKRMEREGDIVINEQILQQLAQTIG